MPRLITFLILYFLSRQVFTQSYVSKDKYTGNWETPTTWIPVWNTPQTNVSSCDITINGYITVHGSLSFTGVSHTLIVNDTLVILGNLTFANNNSLSINGNGIVIVWGDLIINNSATIMTNRYLVVTGDVIKNGSTNQGSFISNGNPEKVFIGGAVSPATLTNNNPLYPALNCTSPATTRYPNSDCGYGNMTDFMNDPLYSFYLTTCSITTPTITASGPATFCAGESVTLTSSAGSTYLWSNGAATQSINVTTTGSYTVRITNAYGCQSEASAPKLVTVYSLPVTPTITASGPTTFCDGDSVTLTSSTGSSYLWSTGATTKSISVKTAGSYTIRVTNANGCQSAASVATIVTVNPLPEKPGITASGPLAFCNGGSVTLTSSAGSSYLWSTGATTQSINVTAAGTYKVRVTNANGCQSLESAPRIVTVYTLPAIPTITASGPLTFCSGDSVTLTSSEGSSYLWSNGATSQSINVTTAGSYTVRTTNASGCVSEESAPKVVTVNTLPATPIITAGGPTAFCDGGSVTLTSSSGSTYLWSTGATSQSINVTETGNYTVRITNESGCQSVASVATAVTVNPLPEAPTITASGPTTFCTGGSVTLTSSTGSTYLWSTGAITPSINITSAGSYSVTVTNSNGCQSPQSLPAVININSLPVVDAGTDTNIPTGTSTILNATVSGAGPFNFDWVPQTELVNASIEDPTTVNLATTTVFILTATSLATSCSNSDTVTISTIGGALSTNPTATPDIICSGLNVQLDAMASGGSGSYTFTWTSTPPGFNSSIARPKVNPTTTTTYNVAVYDGFSTVNSQVTVAVNDLPATPVITAGGPSTFCDGGSVTLTSSAEYGYLWSNGDTTSSINVTTPGDYTVQVTNASGCLSAASAATIVIVNALPATPAITADGPTTFCDGGNVTLTSNAGSYYLWSSGETTPSINVTISGSYTVKVTNASGCQSAASVPTVVTVNALPLTPAITAGGPTTFCEGGSVILTSSAGFSYLWSNGETSKSINVSESDTYTLKVTDVNGCESMVSEPTVIKVNDLPATPVITTGGPTTFCDGGGVTLTSSAGSGNLWSNGETTTNILVTTYGIYTVQVTDTNGCQSEASAATIVTVTALPTTPTITADGPTTFCHGDSVTMISSSASGNFWSNGETSQRIVVTIPGSYTVQVTNANGCQSAVSVATKVTVNPLPAKPVITALGPTTFCEGGIITLTSSSGYDYLWSSGEATQNIYVATQGSYTVQITDANGCESTASEPTIVTVNTLPETPAVTADGPTTFCEGGSVTLTSSAGSGNFWSNGETTPSILVTTPGSYTVQVHDENGCTSLVSSPKIIVVNNLPVVSITSSGDPMCTNDLRTLSGTPAGGMFSIIDGPGSINGNILTATGPGTIEIEYNYTDVCTYREIQSIIAHANPEAIPGPDQELGFVKETHMQAVLSSGETGEWSLISGSGDIQDLYSPTTGITGLSAGENIFLWIVHNDNCEASAEVTLIVKELFIPSVITPNGDGKNDFLKINEGYEEFKLIIINRWGNVEYTSDNYINEWDGRNGKGMYLPNDTYFYVVKFKNGEIKKGSLLIIK
jgi:gliding motility-associated-like protein